MAKRLLTLTLKASVLAAALAVLPTGANAAGLGKITVLSGLGQPLRAEVELSASREELSSLSARLASHDAFKQAGIEFLPALSTLKLVVDKRPSGQSVIRVSTDRPINEPFLDLLLEINWAAGRLIREYTFLLDPVPEVMAQKPAAAPVAPPVAKRELPVAAQPAPAPKTPEPGVAAPADEKPVDKKAEEAKPAGEALTHEVKRGETLRKIAAEARYEGVSLDQMLVAIFRSNRDAFIGNNMHRIKAGRILNIPEREAVASVAANEARQVIAAQTADFNAYRKKLAEAVSGAEAPKEEAPQQAAAGKITAKVEEKVPAAAEAKDQLKVSKAEAAKAAAAEGKLAALEEDIVAKEKALKEAQSRQADLEKNVKELQKLVELKNQGLAEMQKQAAAKAAPAPEVKKPEVAAAPAAPVQAPEPPKPATAPTPPAPVAAEKPVEAPKVPEPAELQKPQEAPKPAAPKTPVAPPPSEPSFADELMDNPAILGGGALVLGLLGFIAYRQRQRRRLQENGLGTPTTAANLATNSVFGATGGQSVDTSSSSLATDFSQASISAIDADEGVDPVAEADVYMAYGRDAQAEEILLDALKTDPTRTAIHVKLLEIYGVRKNAKQFETLASDLYAQTGGVGADWEKAAAMGQKLDPANPLYGGSASAEAQKSTVSTDTTVIVPAGEKPLRDTWTMPGELSQIADAVERGAATVILDKSGEAAAAASDAPAGLDFDLDLGAPAPAAATAAEPAEAAAMVDFDLGVDFQPPAEKQDDYSSEGTIVLNVAGSARTPTDLAIDLKLDDEAAASTPTSPEEGLHFDLDLGAPAPSSVPAAEVIDLEKTIAGANVLDFNFDLGGAPASPAPQPEPSIDLGAINLDLGEPAGDSAPTASEEVATKLELAKAYEEMGDKEGARELLAEVLREGGAEQRDKARGMLDRLG